jgi:hypothetical protein
MAVAAIAIVAAWRERSFAKNRNRFGAVHAPEPRP